MSTCTEEYSDLCGAKLALPIPNTDFCHLTRGAIATNPSKLSCLSATGLPA
jgi:hypothetical protein